MKKHFFTATIALVLIVATALPISASGLLSPALRILSGQLEMHKCGVDGEKINFCADDFDRMIGVTVSAVTVASLPPINEGALMLGNAPVSRNQRIERDSMSQLYFTPHSTSVTESNFRFTYSAAGTDYSIPCTVYLLSEENDAPTVSLLGTPCTKITTYCNTVCSSVLRAVDPEGDAMSFMVVSYPEHGTLRLSDTATGKYCYSPDDGFKGNDSFTYVAYDHYGNRSEAAEVSVEVRQNATATNYTDMNGHWAYAAAIAMSELGVMTGTNGAFLPDEEVTRSEFLTMAMKASGYEVIGSKPTAFSDNHLIPSAHLGYVAAAYDLGFIHGNDDQTGMCSFQPNQPITRAEAAVILCAVFDLKESALPTVFSDSENVPGWASPCMRTLNALGVMNGIGDGCIAPTATVTRAQAAQILMQLTMV